MKSQPIQLGTRSFTLVSEDNVLLERCSRLFAQAMKREVAHGETDSSIEVDLDQLLLEMGALEFVIHPIVARAAAEQSDCLWLDAAAIRSWNGKNVLVMGESFSGKSTLAFACWAYLSCRIVCEDVTFIDQKARTIIPFCRPVSLRPGSLEMVGLETTELVVEGEWVAAPTMYCNSAAPAQFDLAIFLDGSPKRRDFRAHQLSANSFARMALPMSNLIHLPQGAEQFAETLREGGCYRITDGSIRERVEFVRQAIS